MGHWVSNKRRTGLDVYQHACIQEKMLSVSGYCSRVAVCAAVCTSARRPAHDVSLVFSLLAPAAAAAEQRLQDEIRRQEEEKRAMLEAAAARRAEVY